jgi:hypothetical protein
MQERFGRTVQKEPECPPTAEAKPEAPKPKSEKAAPKVETPKPADIDETDAKPSAPNSENVKPDAKPW